jgi:hypothetical protein
MNGGWRKKIWSGSGLDDPSLGQLFCYCGKNGLIIDLSWKLEYYNMILD